MIQRASVIASLVALTVLFLQVGSARAQELPPRDSSGTVLPARDSGMLVLTPARPVQGSIVRILYRPPGAAGAFRSTTPISADAVAMGDSAAKLDPIPRRDTTVKQDTIVKIDTMAGAGIRAGADSAARPDSIAKADSGSTRDAIVSVRGILFGEPLHFEPDSAGAFHAVGGIPVDAPDSARVTLVVARQDGTVDSSMVSLVVDRGAYRMERLTVAPAFGRPPDPPLAARIAREQEQAAEVSRRSHETPRLWRGSFQRPRSSRVTSGFGDGREFNGRIQSRHGGLDLAGAVGAPVVASNRGVVALIGDFYYAGNAVYLDHGAGVVTAYFHLSKIDVAPGDTVEVGARIGLVGATGRVTGPHLHWVARYGTISVDPATLLALTPTKPSAAPARPDSVPPPRP